MKNSILYSTDQHTFFFSRMEDLFNIGLYSYTKTVLHCLNFKVWLKMLCSTFQICGKGGFHCNLPWKIKTCLINIYSCKMKATYSFYFL